MSSTCDFCGSLLAPNTRFCTSCGKATESAAATGGSTFWTATTHTASTSSGRTSTPPPAGTLTFAEDIGQTHLAHGEVIKRVYPVGHVKRAFGWQKGQLVVTDSRVLYKARAKNFLGESYVAREIQISDVSGGGLVTRRGISLASAMAILLGFVLGLLIIGFIDTGARAATSFGLRASSGPSGIAVFLFFMLLIVTAIMVILRLREAQVMFAVYARDVSRSPITLSGTLGRDSAGFFTVFVASLGGPLMAMGRALGILDATDASYSADIAETTALYEDFGSLILDLQSRGILGAD